MTAALLEATEVPLQVAEWADEVNTLVAALRSKTNPKMSSDLTVASALARASVEGALANAEINLESLDVETESAFIAESRARVVELRAKN